MSGEGLRSSSTTAELKAHVEHKDGPLLYTWCKFCDHADKPFIFDWALEAYQAGFSDGRARRREEVQA